MKKIKLTQGKFALVDDEDFERVNQFKWSLGNNNAQRFYKGKTIRLHRFLMKVKNKLDYIDHINGNGLDNRKLNLRICNRNENLRNQKIHTNNSSGYKGVHLKTKYKFNWKKWQARISVNGKKISLGYYKDPKEAAIIYNEAAIKYYGQFARLNNI